MRLVVDSEWVGVDARWFAFAADTLARMFYVR